MKRTLWMITLLMMFVFFSFPVQAKLSKTPSTPLVSKQIISIATVQFLQKTHRLKTPIRLTMQGNQIVSAWVEPSVLKLFGIPAKQKQNIVLMKSLLIQYQAKNKLLVIQRKPVSTPQKPIMTKKPIVSSLTPSPVPSPTPAVTPIVSAIFSSLPVISISPSPVTSLMPVPAVTASPLVNIQSPAAVSTSPVVNNPNTPVASVHVSQPSRTPEPQQVVVYYAAKESAKVFYAPNGIAWNEVPVSLVKSEITGYFKTTLPIQGELRAVFIDDAEMLDDHGKKDYVMKAGVWHVVNGVLSQGLPVPIVPQTAFDPGQTIQVYYQTKQSASIYYTIDGKLWTKEAIPMKASAFEGYHVLSIPSNGYVEATFVNDYGLHDTNQNANYKMTHPGAWTIQNGILTQGPPQRVVVYAKLAEGAMLYHSSDAVNWSKGEVMKPSSVSGYVMHAFDSFPGLLDLSIVDRDQKPVISDVRILRAGTYTVEHGVWSEGHPDWKLVHVEYASADDVLLFYSVDQVNWNGPRGLLMEPSRHAGFQTATIRTPKDVWMNFVSGPEARQGKGLLDDQYGKQYKCESDTCTIQQGVVYSHAPNATIYVPNAVSSQLYASLDQGIWNEKPFFMKPSEIDGYDRYDFYIREKMIFNVVRNGQLDDNYGKHYTITPGIYTIEGNQVLSEKPMPSQEMTIYYPAQQVVMMHAEENGVWRNVLMKPSSKLGYQEASLRVRKASRVKFTVGNQLDDAKGKLYTIVPNEFRSVTIDQGAVASKAPVTDQTIHVFYRSTSDVKLFVKINDGEWSAFPISMNSTNWHNPEYGYQIFGHSESKLYGSNIKQIAFSFYDTDEEKWDHLDGKGYVFSPTSEQKTCTVTDGQLLIGPPKNHYE